MKGEEKQIRVMIRMIQKRITNNSNNNRMSGKWMTMMNVVVTVAVALLLFVTTTAVQTDGTDDQTSYGVDIVSSFVFSFFP